MLHILAESIDEVDGEVFEETARSLSLNIRASLILTNNTQEQPVNARDIVLRKCGQTNPLAFSECYPNS